MVFCVSDNFGKSILLQQVHFVGEAVGIVIADDEFTAKYAAGLVEVLYEENPQYDYIPLPSLLALNNFLNLFFLYYISPVYSIDDALAAESFFPNTHTIKKGDVEKVLNKAAHAKGTPLPFVFCYFY